MLSKSFKAGKCKTALKLAMARIKLLKNKRGVQAKQMRRELAQLLEAGQEQTARIRVEHVIREEKTMSAYDLIEIYCELIVARLPIIESQKSCPIDLKEAISSLVFASPRCADIPELMDVRKHFVAKYGKEFISSALEIRPDCGVNRIVVEKLSAKTPDIETKIKTLTAIAQEHNVKWDSKSFEEQLHKPEADLLNGPNTFANASKMPMESSHASLSSVTNPRNESTTKLFQNDVNSKPTSMNTSSQTHIGTPSTSVSSTLHESRTTDRSGEVKDSVSREENTSFDRPIWNMEFKDATSAAQAAAESAERASMAARAAAELASRGSQFSTGSHESFKYGTNKSKPVKSMGSNLEGAHTVQDSVTKEDGELKISEGMNLDKQNLQIDEVVQVRSRRETESIYGDCASFRGRALSTSSSHSSGTSIDDDMSEINLHKADMKAYGHAQYSFSEADPVVQDSKKKKNENVELGRQDTNESYSKPPSSHFTIGAFDDDTKWDSNIQNNDNNNGKKSTLSAGEGIFGSNQKQPSFSDYSGACFDDYGSDTDDVSIFGRYKEEHLLDSFEEISSFPSAVDTSSPKQHRNGSESSSQLHFVAEPHSIEHSESIKKTICPSQSNDKLPATFDDSDGVSTDSEGKLTSSLDSSGVYEKNHEPGPKFTDNSWKRSVSSGLPSNQTSSRNDRTPRKLIDSERGSSYFPPDEEPQSWQSSKVSATEEAETKDKFGMPSSHSDTRDADISDEFNSESEHGLYLGRLTGGLQNKGIQRRPSVKGTLVGTSVQSQQTSTDTFSIDKPIVCHSDKSSTNLEFSDQERYHKESHREDYFLRNSRASMTDFDKADELVSRHTTGRRSSSGEVSLSSDKTAEVTHDISQRPIASQQDKISEDLGIPSPKSYNQRLQARHAVGSRSRDKVSVQLDQSTDVLPAVDAPKVEQYEQRSRRKTHNELSSRMPLTYFESDDGLEKLDPHQTVGHRSNKDVKLSWRTRNLPSEAEKKSHSRSTGHSDGLVKTERENKPSQTSSPASEPPLNTTAHPINLEGKETSKSLQRNSYTEPPSMTPTKSESSVFKDSLKSSKPYSTQTADSGNNENPTTSSSNKRLTSRESSLKNASHVHPKLPDYDTLAAHFRSLRSNRR